MTHYDGCLTCGKLPEGTLEIDHWEFLLAYKIFVVRLLLVRRL